MFQDLFLQMHQTIEQLEAEFDLVNDIEQELSLLEKYLTIKEMSENLTSEIKRLHSKIEEFEREHGLYDLNLQGTEGITNQDNLLDDEDSEEIVIELDEDDFLTFQRGIGFYDLLMYDQAISNLKEIIKKYPDFNLARLYTAMTYFKKAKYEDAKSEIAFLFKLSDDQNLLSLGHNILGMIYSYENDYEKAIGHYQQAIQLKSNWNEPKFNLAIIYLNENKVFEAIKLFEELYYQNPKDWEVLMYLGKSYQKIKQYELAGEFYRQTYAIIKKPLVIKQIINQLENNQQFHQVTQWYKKWLKIEPDNLNVILGLANNLWLINNKQEGIALVKKALSLDRNNVQALLFYAWMLTDEDNPKAINIINKISEKNLEINERNSLIIANLARLYYLNSNQKTASKFCDILLSSSQDNIRTLGHLVQGLIYLDQYNPNKAVEHFEKTINDNRFPYLDFYLGYSHYLLGSLDKAKSYWNNLLREN